MNKIVNKFLLAEDRFITELSLRQPEFTYRAYHIVRLTMRHDLFLEF